MLKASPLRVPRPGPPGPRSSSGAVHRSSAITGQGHTAVTHWPPKLARDGQALHTSGVIAQSLQPWEKHVPLVTPFAGKRLETQRKSLQLEVTLRKCQRVGGLPLTPGLTSTDLNSGLRTSCGPFPTRELTFRGWPGAQSLLSVKELCITVVGDLQYKAPIHHTVPGLEAAVREVSMVQIPHTLEWM